MEIDIVIAPGRIELDEAVPALCGAVVRFEGRVRPEENGAPISAIVYEAHQPMAARQMERILTELATIHPATRARVRHRIGEVPVGEAAIVLEVVAPHRAEAFAMASAFMDRLKKDVPIWKLLTLPASS